MFTSRFGQLISGILVRMSSSVFLLLGFSFTVANIPWLSERFFIVFPVPFGDKKRSWMRLLEWLVFAGFALLFAQGLEQKTIGSVHTQDWEFYAIFLSLFVVFAFPSFIYRHLILPLLQRKSL